MGTKTFMFNTPAGPKPFRGWVDFYSRGPLVLSIAALQRRGAPDAKMAIIYRASKVKPGIDHDGKPRAFFDYLNLYEVARVGKNTDCLTRLLDYDSEVHPLVINSQTKGYERLSAYLKRKAEKKARLAEAANPAPPKALFSVQTKKTVAVDNGVVSPSFIVAAKDAEAAKVRFVEEHEEYTADDIASVVAAPTCG